MIDKALISDQLLEQYREHGYFTVENLFTSDEVEGVRQVPTIQRREHF